MDPVLTVTWATLVSVPVVSGIVQAVKIAGVVASRFLPLVSIGIGTVVGLIAGAVTGEWLLTVSGVTAGLGAVGLHQALTRPLDSPDDGMHP